MSNRPKDESQYSEVILGTLGENRAVSGMVYPPDVLEKAFKSWIERNPKLSFCELGLPKLDPTKPEQALKRVCGIELNNVCGSLENPRVEDGKLIATFKPAGPKKELLREIQQQTETRFAIRALKSVEGELQIVTWDVVSKEG